MGQKENDARDVAAGVRDDMASAHQHHQLDLLAVVVPLGAAAGYGVFLARLRLVLRGS